MNHELSLSLGMLEQGSWGFRFRLLVHNQSPVKLLLPFPEVYGLRFAPVNTTQEAEWYTNLLISTGGGGFTLEADGQRVFDWKVRPCSIEQPESDDGCSDYYRWCVELRPGEHDVWYQWLVNKDFFDPDSHMRLEDLEYHASHEQAVVWQGEAASNRLRVITTALLP